LEDLAMLLDLVNDFLTCPANPRCTSDAETVPPFHWKRGGPLDLVDDPATADFVVATLCASTPPFGCCAARCAHALPSLEKELQDDAMRLDLPALSLLVARLRRHLGDRIGSLQLANTALQSARGAADCVLAQSIKECEAIDKAFYLLDREYTPVWGVRLNFVP
jgi:hypothetical protein